MLSPIDDNTSIDLVDWVVPGEKMAEALAAGYSPFSNFMRSLVATWEARRKPLIATACPQLGNV
jgi:hypothetical protein